MAPTELNSKRFTILLGGDLAPTMRLLEQTRNTRAIAADSGMKHAAALGLVPELWVGDFDSAEGELQARYAGVPRHVHPTDKDKSDGEIAIDAALQRGATSLLLAGGLGGQTDHALANMALLLGLARRGIEAMASSGVEEAYPLVSGYLDLDVPPGSRLSIAATSDLFGLDIAGVRWPLVKADVLLGSTWTLSNVVTGPVRMGLRAGMGLVLVKPVEG
jgi:thiamine pyrophosphokinase